MKGDGGTKPLNVFEVHKRALGDYEDYIHSFINIADERIRAKVKESLASGSLWPAPLLQFNPAYQTAGAADEWVNEPGVHAEMSTILSGYSLYQHQLEALRLGVQGKDFIVTSGTGSGKSLTYMGAIFNHLIQQPSMEGVQAVVIYPTNALINSQTNEINSYAENYLSLTGKEFPIRHGQYTGQERRETRREMWEHLPNILLTNYMMLELILTRPQERKIKQAIYNNLRFLVLDELHTYRGRQGADVSMLIRRLRSQCKRDVCCIGTSATLASAGNTSEKARTVSQVAGKLFGRNFDPEQVVDETLSRALDSDNEHVSREQVRKAIVEPIGNDANLDDLKQNPVAIWLESNVALEMQEEKIVRGEPKRIGDIAVNLAEITRLDSEICREYVINLLTLISKANLGGGGGQQYYLTDYTNSLRRRDRFIPH